MRARGSDIHQRKLPRKPRPRHFTHLLLRAETLKTCAIVIGEGDTLIVKKSEIKNLAGDFRVSADFYEALSKLVAEHIKQAKKGPRRTTERR